MACKDLGWRGEESDKDEDKKKRKQKRSGERIGMMKNKEERARPCSKERKSSGG